MTQNIRFNSKLRPSTKHVLKERAPQSIILSVVLTLLHSFSIQASAEARGPETRVSVQTSQVLKLAENKRLEASICADSMNRIAVANDRITQIFGDEGTFESQNDEATGQVFLKPTVENGSKSLSLTLITEQGVTQDLTLNPMAKSAKTLILNRDPLGHVNLGRDSLGDGSGRQGFVSRDFSGRDLFENTHRQEPQLDLEKTLSIQAQLLILLKQAMSGQLPANEEEGRSRPNSSLEGYSLTPDQSWQAGAYVIHSFQVENVTEIPLELQEKDFYQPGDLALSFDTRVSDISASGISVFDTRVFQNRILPPEGKITLYVVCHRKADLP